MSRSGAFFSLDSLQNFMSNLAAGKDKTVEDRFFLPILSREQLENAYRGDWLARKIIDIIPKDMLRAWRAWVGEGQDLAFIAAAEQQLNYRQAIQRAMICARLYGGAALVIGTGERGVDSCAKILRPEDLPRNGLTFLQVLAPWQMEISALERDPLSPWFGEPTLYFLLREDEEPLPIHPSRLICFTGHEVPEPIRQTRSSWWGDPVLQALYDAIHHVALTNAAIASLMHEAKIDIIQIPDLARHLSTKDSTNLLTKRFSYANRLKSLNNVLLLDQQETWAQQQINFSDFPALQRSFLQIAAAASDIPATRLLGQSPEGLNATGKTDLRNYYDMLSGRQELELRPKLQRLDAFLLAHAGVKAQNVSWEFCPLWQMDDLEKAQIALQKAQTSQIYGQNDLVPQEVLQGAVLSQLIEDSVYPGL